jgi:RimJ/RimL family protein N-acetyltransferase
MVIATERLRLRPFRESDLDVYSQLCADPEVVRYVGDPFSRREAWLHIAMLLGHWQLRGYGMWAVESRYDGALIGRIGFYEPEGWPGMELGWMLARDQWGRGLATEGARAALQYAFTVLQKSSVISLIHPENVTSVRVAKKLGQWCAGSSHVLGTETLVFQIRQGDWSAGQSAFETVHADRADLRGTNSSDSLDKS